MTQADPAALWQQMRERLVAFVARRIDQPADAEDIVQEVFLKMSQTIDSVRQHERLEAWVYQITRNAIVDHHRRSSTIARTRAQAAADRSLQPGEIDAEESALLAQCLKPLVTRLPEPYREAIVWTEYDGLTQAEAARRARISVPGMKSRVQRARRQLGDLLTACCQVELDARKAVRSVENHGPCPC
ncbi:sigma-70 family RNA polymerase sigma factor [Nonomuraea basaltis]|uniref:sigma-70 family RNA polymerase sigma factor n=1 Tax=Nonomuraea basaltis TaxID=2495887 RepID=UPI00110C4502|nr:sigma-70 family RNA polymerase sigma factor [Nonomuraea basaltis]TMR98459.1 sigma-70 family RNA polymerase sigma factor [Nonomuraea basaltis]